MTPSCQTALDGVSVNHRILIVDDNPAIHDDLRKVLSEDDGRVDDLLEDEALLFGAAPVSNARFELDSAYQGEEALAKVERALADQRPYALAFVDIRMPPGWDGVETISRIRRVDPNLQTVICTAFSDYSWSDIRIRLGQSDGLLILKKPFDNIEVIQLASAMTRKWGLSRQAEARILELEAQVTRLSCELQIAQERLSQMERETP